MKVALRSWALPPIARFASALVTIAATTSAMIVLGVAPASAHTGLESSTPAEGARLTEVPANIELTFTEHISAEFAQVTLTIGESKPLRLDTTVTGPQVVATVPDSAANTGRAAWLIGYRVVSADGHPVSGAVEFSADSDRPSSPSPTTTPTTTPDVATSSAAEPSPVADEETDDDDGGGSLWGLVGALILIPAAVVALFVVAQRNRSTQREP